MIEYTVKVYLDGYKEWFLNGKLHREDGPAIEYASGTKFWYLNGKRHREDGPAIEYAGGNKYWYLNGDYVTEEEHKRMTSPVVEMTVAEINKALGKQVKVVQQMSNEKYTFTYEDAITGTKVTRQFCSEDLWQVAHNTLEFVRSTGFDYVDMLEFSTPDGQIYRAENLD